MLPDQPWQVKLVFSRDKHEIIELPATLSTRRAYLHIREHYPPCAVHILRRPAWRRGPTAKC
jgi:hypothetical protein